MRRSAADTAEAKKRRLATERQATAKVGIRSGLPPNPSSSVNRPPPGRVNQARNGSPSVEYKTSSNQLRASRSSEPTSQSVSKRTAPSSASKGGNYKRGGERLHPNAKAPQTRPVRAGSGGTNGTDESIMPIGGTKIMSRKQLVALALREATAQTCLKVSSLSLSLRFLAAHMLLWT